MLPTPRLHRRPRPARFLPPAALALATALALAPSAPAQDAVLAMSEAEGGVAAAPSAPAEVVSQALARGNYAIVIDLDNYQLSFRRGRTTLWSTKIGVGTGLRLQGPDGSWDFSTPRGVYQVQYKELDPVWYKPDWFYVENGLPVPPPDAPARKQPGGLGAAALYIGHELAIHGTDKPELLGQNVSHGCIRVANADILRLFHNAQVGTEVVIVGGERAPADEATAAVKRATSRRATPSKPTGWLDVFPVEWRTLASDALLARLDEELWVAETEPQVSRWAHVASLLVERALVGDDVALQGLLLAPGRTDAALLREELATFLADLYARGTQRTLQGLAQLDAPERATAAQLLVDAAMSLYHGTPEDQTAPWPTRRVPRGLVPEGAEPAWDALRTAEQAHRAGGRQFSI